MKLSDLKNNILNKTLDDSFLVFVYRDNDFLVNQYVNEIAKSKNLELHYFDSFNEFVSNQTNENVFGEEYGENELKVLKLENIDFPFHESLLKLKNSIIIFNGKILKEVEETWKVYNFIFVDFPKLESWQVIDYIKTCCKGLSDANAQKLYEVTNGNIFRIENEICKIKCFPTTQQDRIFIDLYKSSSFEDISLFTIFNLTTALIKRDFITLSNILKTLNEMDVDAIGLSSILHKNVKDLINIQMDSKATPESLGMSVKQFKAIEYNCGKMSNEKLIKLLKFLDEIDFKLKSGCLDISNEQKIYYIICEVLEK